MYRFLPLLSLAFISSASFARTKVQEVRVDFQQPVNTQILGSGVQWSAYPHADSKTAEWGPLMTPEKWDRVCKRLDFIRPGVVRVMDQAGWRYFRGVDEAGQPILDFQTEEVQSLFRVLDYCQKRQIVVVFGEWGAPGYWNEPGNIDRADDPRWISMISRYLHFLVVEKGYTCIQYYQLVNEPNGNWASVNGDWEQWEKGVRMLNDSLRTRGLSARIQVAGPDVVPNYDNPASAYKGTEWIDQSVLRMNQELGIYDLHAYPDGESVRSGDFGRYYGALREKVRSTGKKMILGELGLKYSGALGQKNRRLAEADSFAGDDDSNMFVYDYFYGLDVADALIQAMNVGYEGVVAWDLDDAMHTEGDLGDKHHLKRWGMWNSLGTELCGNPEDEALRPWFYTWSLLCRFFPSGSHLATVTLPTGCPVRILAGQKGEAFSIALLNNTDKPSQVRLRGCFLGETECHRYLYQEGHLHTDSDGFPIPVEPSRKVSSKTILEVAPHSFTLLTNLKN
jgi:hypothetical protein